MSWSILQNYTDYGKVFDKTWSDKLVDQYVDSGEILDDYIIYKTGSVFKAIGKGQRHSEDGLVAAIQWAHDELDGPGSIGVKYGYYDKEWEQKLTISNNGVRLHSTTPAAGTGVCYFKAKDALNDDMIVITGKKCYVGFMTFDGNKTNQASGRGIYDASGGSGDFHMERVYVFYTKNEALKITGEGSSIWATYSEYSDEEGWVISSERAAFIGCWACANVKQGFMVMGDKNTFLGCNADDQSGGTGHGWLLQDVVYNRLVGCGARSNAGYGFCLYGASKNILDGILSIDNTNNGVYLLTLGGSTYCLRNSIQGQIHNNGAYGIREADANQDRNIVASGTIVTGHSTAQVSLQGVNSIKSDDVIED